MGYLFPAPSQGQPAVAPAAGNASGTSSWVSSYTGGAYGLIGQTATGFVYFDNLTDPAYDSASGTWINPADFQVIDAPANYFCPSASNYATCIWQTPNDPGDPGYRMPITFTDVYSGATPVFAAWYFWATINPSFFRVAGSDLFFPAPGMINVNGQWNISGPAEGWLAPQTLALLPNGIFSAGSLYQVAGTAACGTISDGGVSLPIYGALASLSITPGERWANV